LNRNGLGHILGVFFAISSSHTSWCARHSVETRQQRNRGAREMLILMLDRFGTCFFIHFYRLSKNPWTLAVMYICMYIFLNCGQCLYFSFSTHKQCILSHFIHNSTAMFFLKNLIPLRDSNPGLLVPEADAMSTAPRICMYILTKPTNRVQCYYQYFLRFSPIFVQQICVFLEIHY
jgi:hypothetical protein